MTYRVITTTIVDSNDRVVFDALDNKLIRRELCVWMNTARAEAERSEYAEARAAAKTELIDNIISTWEPMTNRLIESESHAEAAEARAAQAEQATKELHERTRQAEQRAAQAEADAADLLKAYREQKETIETLRRQLEQAQEIERENDLKLNQILDLEELLYSTRILNFADGTPCWCCLESSHTPECLKLREATKMFYGVTA